MGQTLQQGSSPYQILFSYRSSSSRLPTQMNWDGVMIYSTARRYLTGNRGHKKSAHNRDRHTNKWPQWRFGAAPRGLGSWEHLGKVLVPGLALNHAGNGNPSGFFFY